MEGVCGAPPHHWGSAGLGQLEVQQETGEGRAVGGFQPSSPHWRRTTTAVFPTPAPDTADSSLPLLGCADSVLHCPSAQEWKRHSSVPAFWVPVSLPRSLSSNHTLEMISPLKSFMKPAGVNLVSYQAQLIQLP